MNGKIVKGIAGFYYVYVGESGLYECKAKGIFRNEGKKPLVGDDVKIEVLDEAKRLGSLTNILPRKNSLIRPAVANVDQAVVIFSFVSPKPNLMLLDRFLVMMHHQGVPVSICFNKKDLASIGEMQQYYEIYEKCGYQVVLTDALQREGIDALRSLLHGKTTVVAGPSGVGKSSLTNHMQSGIKMETGEISRKLGRGRHTTRHTQLIPIDDDTYIMDTPGFSSLNAPDMDKEELQYEFPEFKPYIGSCRFYPCMHIHEPGCEIKNALMDGVIEASRYQNYAAMYQELEERAKRRY